MPEGPSVYWWLKFLLKESPKGYKAQIEWYMNLENQIRGIIDVGKRDAELATEAFGRSKIHTKYTSHWK